MAAKGKIGIVRVERVSGEFYVAHKNTANDEQLSLEARGMLAYLFSKPPEWKCKVTDLIRKSPAGRDKIYRILNELVSRYYIHREQEIYDNGKFGKTNYTVFEYPPLHPDFEPENATRIWQEHIGYEAETASGFSGSGPQTETASGFTVYGKPGSIINNNKESNNEKESKTKVSVADQALFSQTEKCSQCKQGFRVGELVGLEGNVHAGKEYCVVCRDIHEIMDAWRAAFPRGGKYKKRHPNISTVRNQFVTRLKVSTWKQTCLDAIVVAKGNLALSTESWFKLEWLLKNDGNARRAADNEWKWKHDKYLKNGAATDGKDFETVWASLAPKIASYRPDKSPVVKDPAEKYIVDSLGWRNLSGQSAFDAKSAARAKWQDFQTAGVLSTAMPSVADF